MKPTILVVEDEQAISTLLTYNLEKEGYKVEQAYDGEEALMMCEERIPDLILMDWMMPKLSGVETCRRLRRKKRTMAVPIILITARGEEADRVSGLNIGADDYVVKPFSVPELMARVKALLRRTSPTLIEDVIRQGVVEMNMKEFKVYVNGELIHLGPTEFRLLEHFIRNPARVYSREQLLDSVWGHDVYVEARTVDVHIGRLRKVLKSKGNVDPIRTVRSAGYAFEIKKSAH